MANNLYDILGVSQTATTEEIVEAYAAKKVELNTMHSNGEIETPDFINRLDELNKARETLTDATKRTAYNNEIALESTGAELGARPKRKTHPALTALTACILTVAIGSTAIGGYALGQYNARKNMNQSLAQTSISGEVVPGNHNPEPTPNESEATTEPESKEETEPEKQTEAQTETEPETQAPVVDSTVPEMVNLGDAKDDKLVTERATKLLEEMNAAGLYNMGTNAPYTVDELKTLIQYMNGAYKPQNEDEAYTLVNEELNFAVAPLNSEHVLYAVQYQGGEDSFKDTVQGFIDNFHRVNIVDNMLLGNTAAYPYLKWFEDQYNAMLCTTDRDECAKIYDSLMQSLADMVYGDGFTLDGKIYDKNDFLGLDRVNSGNVLQVLVYIMEPFRTTKTQDTYTVHNKLISANPEDNQVTVEYLKITEHFNAMCEDDLSKIAVDDDGLLLIDQPDGKNFAYINQVNTINRALMEYYGKDNAYTNVYQKSLN